MAEQSETLQGLSLDDIRLDARGRVVITNPSIAERLKATGRLKSLAEAGDPLNIICCGNGSCLERGVDLGSIVERFVGRSAQGTISTAIE